jgi:4-amino-4-deoxy-L-arabinose transferase-like glycosyltransferase
LALIAAGRRFFTPTVGYLAALIYISTPWIAHVSTTGLVEGVSAFYLILALYAVMLWRQEKLGDAATPLSREPSASLGRLALAGFLAGAAVSCKYPAALFLALPLTVWIGVSSGRQSWKAAGVFVLAVLAGCGLWSLRIGR